MELSSKNNLTSQELLNLSSLQIELDTLYEEKARGAFTRSRQTWLEQGEKNTKYVFNLEKRSVEMSSLNNLLINNIVSEDQKEISQYVTQFYKHLYDSNSVISDMDTFLNGLGKAKTISKDFKLFCDDEIQLEEIKELSRIGQALPSVNHTDPIHLSTNHAHLHPITTVITTSIRAPATVHSPSDLVDTTLLTQAEYLPCLTYPLLLTSCVFSLCSPLPPDRLSPWSVCSSCVSPSHLPVISVDKKTVTVTRLPIVRTIFDVIHSPEVSVAHPVK